MCTSSTNSEIREGMSRAEIAKAGGHESASGDIIDKHGHSVWTTRGNLRVSGGTAKPVSSSSQQT